MLQIFMEVLLSIFPIFAIIGIGYKLQGAHWFSTSFSAELSRLIMKIALPASIFTSVIRQLDASNLLLLAAVWCSAEPRSSSVTRRDSFCAGSLRCGMAGGAPSSIPLLMPIPFSLVCP